jgi:O-antigen ligase
VRFLVLLIAALVPVVITPGLLFHFDITPKVAILLYGMSLFALGWRETFASLLLLLELPEGRWYCALMGLQIGLLAISTWTSDYPSLSLYGSEWRRLGSAESAAVILFGLVVAAWGRHAGNLTLLLRFCAGSGVPIAVYAISQYFGWDPLLPGAKYQAGEGPYTIVRPPGTLAHAGYLAPYLLFVFFCAMAATRRERFERARALAYLAAALAAVALLLSGTRAGLAGLAVGCIALLCFVPGRVGKRQIALVIAALALLGALWISPAGAKLRARVHWSADDPWGGARLLLWRDTMRMASAHLATGLGPEVFVLEFPRAQSPELARAYPDFYHESPHNSVLDALVAQGLAGPILLVAAWGVAIFAGFKGWRDRVDVAPPLLAGALAVMVDQQFSVFTLPTALSFYILQAMLVAGTPGPRQVRTPAGARLVAGAWTALIVSFALPFAVLASRFVMADRELEAAKRSIEHGDPATAKSAYQSHGRWAPTGTGSDLYYSRAMAAVAFGAGVYGDRLDALAEAAQAGARAARYSEQRANAWYSLATIFASQGDQASVERCLRNAIAWAPNWFKSHWALAQVLRLSGRTAEAQKEADAAVNLSGGRYLEVTATQDELNRASGNR